MDSAFIKRILLAWLALPLTALDWAIAWRKLPEHVVMKTGANGQPLAWASRAAAMRVDLTVMTVVLLFGTAVGFLVAFQKPWKATQGAGAVLFLGVLVFLVMNGVLWFAQVP